MFKFESESAPRHLIQEMDGLCQFASGVVEDGAVAPSVPGDTGQDRFFVMPHGVVLGGPAVCEIRAYTPGLSPENLQVYVVNNLLAFHGTTPLSNLDADAADENPGLRAEFYRAVRLPRAVLGETLEVDCLDDGTLRIRCQWDPTSEPMAEDAAVAETGRSIPRRAVNRVEPN